MNEPKNSILPKASFWMGISSLFLCITPFSFILSFPAFTCGLISLFRKDARKQRSYSLIGMLAGLLMILVFWGMTPAMLGALNKDIRMECSANLKIIGAALQSYSNDYGGEYPPYDGAKGMNFLWRQDYIKDSTVFACPSIPARYAKKGADLTENNLGYFYRVPNDSNDTPVVWDKPGSHKSLKSYSLIEAYMKFYFPKRIDDELIYKNVLYREGYVFSHTGKNWQKDAGIIKEDPKSSKVVTELKAMQSSTLPNSKEAKKDSCAVQANQNNRLSFTGTVLKIETAPEENSLANWIVTFRVDKVTSGEFGGNEFSFRIHSPSKSGLEKDKQYKVEAEKTENGYNVDQSQWTGK